MTEPLQTSPLEAYLDHLRRGELGYQHDPLTGNAVFFPRVIAPGHGGPLEWRVSKGFGTVYATTVVHQRGAAPHNVAMIDVDEGYRMMSSVIGIAPEEVKIGMRVKFEVEEIPDDDPRPVFRPIEGEAQ